MDSQIELGGIKVTVTFKNIKNVHLSVYPPEGRVRVSAPSHMNEDTIRVFLISKLDWIKKQRQKISEQERETPREYIDRESHYLWGERYLLKVIESDTRPSIELKHRNMILKVRPGTTEEKKQDIVEQWYRNCLRREVVPLIEKWEPEIGVTMNNLFVQRMKTRWGSCNPVNKSIRLNTDLAKKPRQCLEFILVHEMIHIIEPTHNERFISLMDYHMPKWRHIKKQLNLLPVKHEAWDY